MKKIPAVELIGKKFNRLTLLKEVAPRIKPNGYPGGEQLRRFLCRCDCGNVSEIGLRDVKSGNTKSCGCLNNENITSHQLTHHSLYNRWIGIKQRCYNPKTPNYKNYGGRGIIMCDEWKNDFKSFYDWTFANGYQPGLQIDRINNDGNYEPSNCRFVTPAENNRNQRIRKDSLSLRG